MTTKNNKVNKVPNLRFPEFEGEWEEKKLGEVTTYVDYRGKAPIKTNEGHFLVTARNIKKGFIDYESSKEYVSNKDYLKVMSKGLPEIGDILFTTEAPMGNVAQIDNKNIALAQRVIKFSGGSNIENSYLLYYMLSDIFQKKISEKAIGTTVQGISGKELHQIKIKFPQISEQNKIASFLSLIDERIQTQSKIIEGLKSHKAAMSKKIFMQKLRFKDQNGNEFLDWDKKKFGDITTIVNKKNKSNEKLPVYSINNKSGFIPQSEQFEGVDSDSRGYDIKLYKIINKNTFAYNPARINVGSIGYSGNLDNIIISSLYVCFKTKEFINDNFLLQYFKTNLFNREVLKNVEGGVRDYLFYENFARINLIIPSFEEQTKISNFLSSLDNKIELETTLLQQLKLQKQYFLQQMFI